MPRTSLLAFLLLASTPWLACQRHHPSGEAEATPAAAPAPPLKPAPPTPLAEKKEDLGNTSGWSPALDAFLERSLPAGLLSPQAARAVRPWCPAFAQEAEADKRAFWAYTFQALAAAEAGLKPTADVHHTQRVLAKTDTVTHRPIRQEGLLQLTYEDAQRYGCDFDWPHDSRLPERSPERTILTPERNLACGLLIMDNQITQQGKPLIARTSYWATLQPGTRSYRVFANKWPTSPPPAACMPAILQAIRPAPRADALQWQLHDCSCRCCCRCGCGCGCLSCCHPRRGSAFRPPTAIARPTRIQTLPR